MQWAQWEKRLTERTERFLTWRKRRKLRKKEKQKRKNQVLDWVEALLWAAVVVLLINQYLLQGYAVPTGSMEDTILGEDRLFVNKLVYGPELIPGWGKFKGADPHRGDIVVFVNPNYKSEIGRDISGVEELFHRLVYMLTFTLVNLDVDKKGNPAHHFLVKRLIGMPGDRIRMRDGRVEVLRQSEDQWTPEEELKDAYRKLSYNALKKFFPYEKYDLIRRNVVTQMLMQRGLPPDSIDPGLDEEYARLLCDRSLPENIDVAALSLTELDAYYKQVVLLGFGISPHGLGGAQITFRYQKKLLELFSPEAARRAGEDPQATEREYKKLLLAYNFVPASRLAGMSDAEFDAQYQALPVHYIYLGDKNLFLNTDEYFESFWRERVKMTVTPYNRDVQNGYARRDLGWYIPEHRFFPMGDNRDNSRDARWFGPVKLGSLLGRPLFRFWPLPRFGAVR